MKIVHTICALAVFLATPYAYAGGLNYLKDGPVAKFSDEDMSMMKQTVRQALNEVPDGESLDWKNEKTGSAGTVTPLKTIDKGEGKCRSIRLNNSYKTLKGEYTETLCRQSDGSWKVPAR